MTITVNERPIDVTLESERTALDLVNGLNDRLKESGMIITDFDIDGRESSSLAETDLAALSAASVGSLAVRAACFPEVIEAIAVQAAETADSLEALLPALADTSVSLQTGKDREALEAIRAFSEYTEASTRIFGLMQCVSADGSTPSIGSASTGEFFDSLNGILRDLTGAFENKDSVLLGDIAEYEIVPRLRDLIAALRSLR
jgi:hypothetical protein